MLPLDIKNLIMEFHDSYNISMKRRHVNLVVKSAFAEWRGRKKELYDMFELFGREIRWMVLTTFLEIYDKRLIKIRDNNSCFSKIWTGYVPWD